MWNLCSRMRGIRSVFSLYTPLSMRVTFPEAMHIQNSCMDVELVFYQREREMMLKVRMSNCSALHGCKAA